MCFNRLNPQVFFTLGILLPTLLPVQGNDYLCKKYCNVDCSEKYPWQSGTPTWTATGGLDEERWECITVNFECNCWMEDNKTIVTIIAAVGGILGMTLVYYCFKRMFSSQSSNEAPIDTSVAASTNESAFNTAENDESGRFIQQIVQPPFNPGFSSAPSLFETNNLQIVRAWQNEFDAPPSYAEVVQPGFSNPKNDR